MNLRHLAQDIRAKADELATAVEATQNPTHCERYNLRKATIDRLKTELMQLVKDVES